MILRLTSPLGNLKKNKNHHKHIPMIICMEKNTKGAKQEDSTLNAFALCPGYFLACLFDSWPHPPALPFTPGLPGHCQFISTELIGLSLQA